MQSLISMKKNLLEFQVYLMVIQLVDIPSRRTYQLHIHGMNFG